MFVKSLSPLSSSPAPSLPLGGAKSTLARPHRDPDHAAAGRSPTQAALDAWFDRANATYALGEALSLFARPGADGYLTAFSIGPTGDVTQLYPNAFHPDNFVRAGETCRFRAPAPAVVNGPVGFERVKIVLTRQPAQIVAQRRALRLWSVPHLRRRRLDPAARSHSRYGRRPRRARVGGKNLPSVASSVSSTHTRTIIIDASGYRRASEDGTLIL